MKNLRKKIIATILAATLCMASSLVVFAQSSPSNDGHWEIVYLDNDAVVTSVGNLIDSDGIITSGYGTTITLTMDRAYYAPYFRAGTSGNANNAVACDLIFPNGSCYDLGEIYADGSKTPYLHYTGTAPAGSYTFSFQGTNSGTTGFAAFMYSAY